MKHQYLSTRRRSSALRAVAIVPALVAALALAACSTGAPTVKSTTAASGTGGGKGINIVIMGGAASDPFWSTVKRGGEAAATAVEAAGGKVTFLAMPNYNNFNPDAAKLVATMKSLNPSAVIIPDWAPSAQNANIEAISSAGIPVIIYNSGEDQVKTVGAQLYIGSDDYTAGVAGGKKFAAEGAKNVICVNTLPGTVNEDARCKGVADGAVGGGAKSSSLNLPSTQFGDPSAVTQAIKGALLKDPTIDGVVTIGTTDSDSAAAAISQANDASKVKLGSFDVSASGLTRIKAGTQLFSIDQQPYAQGYYAVSAAFQQAAYGIYLPESPLLTGPALITKDNINFAINGTKLGVR